MHIEEKDSLEVYDFLRYERDRGMEWMLYGQENGKVTVPNIFCFVTQDEMTGFRKQYPEFTNGLKEANLETVVDALAEKLGEGKELQPKSVDLLGKKSNGLMVKKHIDENKYRQKHGVR